MAISHESENPSDFFPNAEEIINTAEDLVRLSQRGKLSGSFMPILPLQEVQRHAVSEARRIINRTFSSQAREYFNRYGYRELLLGERTYREIVADALHHGLKISFCSVNDLFLVEDWLEEERDPLLVEKPPLNRVAVGTSLDTFFVSGSNGLNHREEGALIRELNRRTNIKELGVEIARPGLIQVLDILDQLWEGTKFPFLLKQPVSIRTHDYIEGAILKVNIYPEPSNKVEIDLASPEDKYSRGRVHSVFFLATDYR